VILLLFATMLLVFLRAFQTQNVIHKHYLSAVGTSYLMAIGEVTLVLMVVEIGWTAIPWIGTGGALGVTLSMYVHNRCFKKEISGE
jgi:uncharacterized membrane protein